MTLAQLEEHLKKSNIEQFEKQAAPAPAGAANAPVNPTAVLQNVCGAYKAIKPFLVIIVNFPLLPASVKNAVKSFMNIMNTVCP